LVLLILFALAAVYLITEHLAHVTALLPYVLLVLCPFMHLLMHGGHQHQAEEKPKRHEHHSAEEEH
jgi:uncharacterized membrane protein